MNERIPYLACPLCESRNLAALRTGDCSGHALYDKRLSPTIAWKKCGDCDHVFTDGYYTEEACRILFGRTQERQQVGGLLEQNRILSARMIEKVLPYAAAGTWLDVGFGNGSLLFTAQEFGFRPVGIDLRSENVQAMKSIGFEAHCVDIAGLTLPEPCAVVSMADVLEHMPFPKDGLRAANRLLRTGGVLLVSMPNTESFVWQAMTEQDEKPYWGELEHYHNFSRTRLYALLEAHGFGVARYGISERYRACMEVVAVKRSGASSPG